jgi:hypothetical protein
MRGKDKVLERFEDRYLLATGDHLRVRTKGHKRSTLTRFMAKKIPRLYVFIPEVKSSQEIQAQRKS